MSNIFTVNPIKVNLISIKNTIKQTFVFIGIVPNNVKQELIKIEKSQIKNIKPNNKVLTKFYGKSWQLKLGIRGLDKSIIGGADDDFSFDDDVINDEKNEKIDEIITEISEKPVADPKSQVIELQKLKQPVTEPEEIKQKEELKSQNINAEPENMISIDDLMEEDLTTIGVDVMDDSLKISQITKTEGNNLGVKFIFSDPHLSIYPEDKVLEFKKKLYTVLNIPIFRQHIWYVYQGRTFPLSYSIFRHNSLLYINIQRLLNLYNNSTKTVDLIENIPVCIKYYQMKQSLKVITNDTFSILDDYFHKYSITEFNLLDLDDFIKPSRTPLQKIVSERYQLELLYYSFIIIYWPMLSIDAFIEYIKSENNIPKFYPDLHEPRQNLIHKYKLEKKIMDTKYDLITNPAKKENLKNIRGKITNSIVSSIISVLKYQNSKDTILFLRNLFDKFPLTYEIPGCKCYITHNGKKVILSKSYKKYNFINESIELDSIVFKIRVHKDSIKLINLILYKNGNYLIRATWPEEKQYDFDDIFNIVKKLTQPIIDKINSFDSYVLANKKCLPIISKNNSKFTEIGMSMFYKKTFTDVQFNIIKSILSDYKRAGIVNDRNIEKSLAEYYFSKGMYQFNVNRIEKLISLNNYYDFLTDGVVKQKWYTIFQKTRITRIYHRFSDIKIEIIGIKEHEFFIFYNFILTLFEIYNNQSKHIKTKDETHKKNIQTIQERKIKKSLRNLKEQDPILYKFKKMYKTENIYSKICQKPYQPLLLNKQGYDQLAPDKKKNATKYWNFTTNKDAYYVCPNPKYPYIKFIIKRHPKDYCIPCCKKSKISSNPKDPKRIIYDICMKDHKYIKEERTITMGSRYIMSYGKDVEPGRLSRLPENSLEPMFYETYSINEQGMDQECVSTDGYYLYGMEQNYNGIPNVGVLNILITTLETTVTDFIAKIIKVIKATPNKFRILLNGQINKYFNNLENFITTINTLFVSPPNTIKNLNKEIPWDEIFINIGYLFLNINMIYFKHKKNDSVKLILPSYISNKEQFLSQEFKNIIIFKKRKNYYPIYLLNTNVFFKSKLFTKKIFNYNDSIIKIISRLVESHFNERIKMKIMDNINLTIIHKFIKHSNYKLKKLFINSANMCYYVHIQNNAKKDIFMPIELSYHLESSNVEITYEMYNRHKNGMSIENLIKFISDFNRWISVKSEKAGMIDMNADKKLPLEQRVQPIYPYIKINNWLVLTKVNKQITNQSNVVGFISHNINYYIKDITLKHALKIKKAKIIPLYYDPDIINKQIFMKSKVTIDKRCFKIGKSIYKSNLYQLLLLEFMTIFNQQKNINIRKQIKKKLLGNLNKDFDELMSAISKLVIDCDDYNKIKTQICEFINNHHSKNLLFHEIDDSFYKFDRELFEKIKKLPKEKLYNELYKISQKFVSFGDVDKIKDFDFPNMYISCQTKGKTKNEKYCKNYKFIIDKRKLKNILEIMASDILNPVKEKWIFSSVFSDNVVSFYKFIRRPDELIKITIED